MWAMTRGGQLTEAVRRRPYSVVLFDEVEKGASRRVQHPASGAGRRPYNRQSGPHGGFPQHHNNPYLNLGSDIILGGIKNGEISEAARSGGKRAAQAQLPPRILTVLTR